VARPVTLAQASQCRLGKMNRDSPRTIFVRKVTQATSSTFERASTSPRREGSRLSEILRVLLPLFEPSPRRRGTRLSEHVSPERGFGRDSAVFCCVFTLG